MNLAAFYEANLYESHFHTFHCSVETRKNFLAFAPPSNEMVQIEIRIKTLPIPDYLFLLFLSISEPVCWV